MNDMDGVEATTQIKRFASYQSSHVNKFIEDKRSI